MSMLGTKWKLHGNGRSIRPGEVVKPDERLAWPLTIGVGMQHVVAMFGATFLVPIITGMPPATTLFFSGIGTLLFLVITKGQVPSYLGSSFAFIAPIMASQQQYGVPGALGGVVLAGVGLAIIGAVVQKFGAGWINRLMPPIVTGAIVGLIGLNLAPAAKNNFDAAPVTALITLATIIVTSVFFRGILGRLSILVGVVVGYFVAMIRGEVDFSKMDSAAWVGLPFFQTPEFHLGVVGLFVPVVLVLVAENIGHVKSVSAMTGQNLDGVSGRALMADGAATVLAGMGGGSGTTTYAENIGVMAATKVYSTAAYWVAGAFAVVLSFSPKFGELIATVPAGVLGGAATMLYGMIGVLGVKIWVQNKVNFSNPINLTTAAVALIVGIADYTWTIGDLVFTGIALGSAAALVIYHGMKAIAKVRGTVAEPETEGPVAAAASAMRRAPKKRRKAPPATAKGQPGGSHPSAERPGSKHRHGARIPAFADLGAPASGVLAGVEGFLVVAVPVLGGLVVRQVGSRPVGQTGGVLPGLRGERPPGVGLFGVGLVHLRLRGRHGHLGILCGVRVVTRGSAGVF
jgi:NCS2 family nucleobase:cation symporter-2